MPGTSDRELIRDMLSETPGSKRHTEIMEILRKRMEDGDSLTLEIPVEAEIEEMLKELDEDFELATSKDFEEADRAMSAAEEVVRLVDEHRERAENRMEFGRWLAKKCKKYPKSALWLLGFALLGVSTGAFLNWLGGGLIVLIIGHIMSEW